jgi:hypothetical protein
VGGVAGGDGTGSVVAAVATDTGRPLVVVPAGARNHFARDLGLRPPRSGRALDALVDGEPIQVDLGVLSSRVFINNVSFGMYADALLEPGYREDKPGAFATVAPDYLKQGLKRTEVSGGRAREPAPPIPGSRSACRA